jgi:thymidylate kinase
MEMGNETIPKSFTVQQRTLPSYNIILNDYFRKLKENNVIYCVLSGYEGLPEVYKSNDIDILVSKNNLHEASIILKYVFKDYGSGYYVLHKFNGRHTYLFFFQGIDGWVRESIKIDLFINFEFRGRVFLSSREILSNIIPYNNLYIPCAMHQAYLGVVKGILKGGSAWKKYMARIQEGLAGNANGMESLLRRIFREKTTKSLVSYLSAGDTECLEKIRKRMIYETYTNSFLNHPIRFPLNLISYFYIRFGNMLKPPNYMIAVLGPDGSGKSTLIEKMKVLFQDVFKVGSHGVKVFHIRPGLFPTITELLKKKSHSAEKSSLLREAWNAPSSTISFARLLCFWADYVLGYFVKILPELGSYHVVVLDRYYYDLLIDPSRYKIRLPHRVMKAFFAVLPTPDIAFVLDAPPEIIYPRKRELNEATIGILLNEYRNLKNEIDNVHILQATNSPEELSMEVVSTFLKSAATSLN